ncbi:MAG: hypothetical protein JNK67_22925 [Alphaproteobacteria bacterium]|nr:hypothetical protein [Alphaproteobacteria bacterium]
MRIRINRAPVLTLWAAVVAERLGHDRAAALTFGRAVAGFAAYAKAKRLGLAEESRDSPAQRRAKAKRETAEIMGRSIPIAKTKDGVRALDADGKPINPAGVDRYLDSKFGDGLVPAREAMTALAASMTTAELPVHAFSLYEDFRPTVPEGVKGWGAAGELNTDKIRSAKPATSFPRGRAKSG